MSKARTISTLGNDSVTLSGNVSVSGTFNATGESKFIEVANTNLLVNDRIQVANAEALYVSLSGDNVTGDLSVSGNVAIDTNTFFVDSVNNRVGVRTLTPEGVLHVNMGDQSANNYNGLLITSNADSITTGPDVNIIRRSATPATGDNIGHIQFSGRNTSNLDFGYVSIFGKIERSTTGSENGALKIIVAKDGLVTPNEARTVASFGSNTTIINPRKREYNFKVSTGSRENMIFVDSGNTQVSIGYGNTGSGSLIQNQGTLQVFQRGETVTDGIAIDAGTSLQSSRLYMTANDNFDISRGDDPIIRITPESGGGVTKPFRPELLTQTVIRNAENADNEPYNRGTTPPMLTIQYSSVGRSYDFEPATELAIERSGDSRISLVSLSTNTQQGINFGDPDDEDAGGIYYSHNTNSMRFRTNGADGISIESGGSLVIPAGLGISFGRDVGSGTTVSTYLDDYEEGTWTPTSPSSGTISNAAGAYTKVGRIVVLQFYITTSGFTITQGLNITGLPFTASAGSSPNSAVEGTGVCLAEEGLYFVWVQDNTNGMNILVERELSGSADGSENIRGSVTYIASV